MIGLDTNVLIDLFKDNSDLKDLLEGIDDEVVLNYVIYSELMFGLNLNDKKYKLEEEFYDNFFKSYLVLNLDFNASKKASYILSELQRKGGVIGQLDCIIAGILLSNGVNRIITKNKKHFENIKGLEVISY